MKRNVLVTALVFILFAAITSATPMPEIWLKFNGDITNYGSNTSTYAPSGCSGCPFNSSIVKSGSHAIQFGKTANDVISLTPTGGGNITQKPGTICSWVYEPDTLTNTFFLIGGYDLTLSNGVVMFVDDKGGMIGNTQMGADIRNPGQTIYQYVGDLGTSYDTWHHYCMRWNATNLTMYINGTNRANFTYTPPNGAITSFEINGYGDYGSGNDGSVTIADDWRYWGYYLTEDQITGVYNMEEPTTNFTITATDLTFGGSISVFSVIFNQTVMYSTTTGSIVTAYLSNSSALHNVSVNASGYFWSNYTHYNLTSDLAAEMNASYYYLNISAYSAVHSNVLIETFSVNITRNNQTRVNSTTTGTVREFLLAPFNYTVKINASGYMPDTKIVELNSSYTFYNFSLYPTSYSGVRGCNATLNATALNFTILDENYQNQLLYSDVAGVADFTNYAGFTGNYSFNFSNVTTFKLCVLSLNNMTYYTDVYLEYESLTGGVRERYYLVNASVNNVTQFVNIYNFNSSNSLSTLDATVVDHSNYQKVRNIITRMRRFFPATNEWRQVQVDKSDELGQLVFYVYERETLYDFIFQRGTTTLYTSTQMKFICTSSLCDVTFQIPVTPTASTDRDVQFDISFNNITKVISVAWTDPAGLSETIWVEITKETPNGIIVLSNQTSTSASGSLSYNASGQEGLLIVKAYSEASPWLHHAIAYIEMQSRKLFEVVAQSTKIANGQMEAGFWSFGVILTTTFAGAFGPFAALMGLSLGLVVTYFLVGFNFLNLVFIVSLGVLIVYAAWKVRQ